MHDSQINSVKKKKRKTKQRHLFFFWLGGGGVEAVNSSWIFVYCGGFWNLTP